LASGCGVATRGNLLVDSQGQLLTGVSEVVTSWTLAPGGGDTIRLEPRFSMKRWLLNEVVARCRVPDAASMASEVRAGPTGCTRLLISAP
jgi:hypothetical protein